MVGYRFLTLAAICTMLVLLSPAARGAEGAEGGDGVAVDASSMEGKVLCGYQGWFNTPDDGAGRGWVHWGRAPMGGGDFTVDLLPDMTELSPDERHATALKTPDGKPVEVFSSYNPKTVDRHFQWMQTYGIDGVFLQRFVIDLQQPAGRGHNDRVLSNVRQSVNRHGRVWGLMYDLTGLRPGAARLVIDDWKRLVDEQKLTQDGRYIHHQDKPVVALWGIGFAGGKEGRSPLFEDGLAVIRFLKDDPTYGGNTVLIGVPATWREQLARHDADAAAFEKVVRAADMIQPWTVGRCRTLEDVENQAKTLWAADLAWCRANGKQYLPVVYPGFSWHNLRNGQAPLDQIPRLGGRFLWAQYVAAQRLKMSMVYQAMFDEVDEGTAIFKCTNNVPDPGQSAFVTYEGLPSDFYLKLVGQATRLIRGEITPEQESLIRK